MLSPDFNMKYSFTVVLFLSLLAILGGSLYFSDSRKLNRAGYSISAELPDNNVVLYKITTNRLRPIVIDQNITDLKFIGNYVAVLKLVAISKDCTSINNKQYIDTFYSKTQQYYLIDVINKEVLGPYTSEQYTLQLKKLNLDKPELKIPENYYYTNISYKDWELKCLKAPK